MAGAAVEPMGTLAQVSAAGLPNGLRKEVFGFLPYWMLTDSALASMNYQLVSTIAYFSVNANMDGNLVKGPSGSPTTGWAGWTSSRMTDVINRAHANGVKVVLTVTMMAWDSASANRQAQLLGSSVARSRLVNQIVTAVRARGADGVNLDFEPLATSLRDEYVSFVRQLKRAPGQPRRGGLPDRLRHGRRRHLGDRLRRGRPDRGRRRRRAVRDGLRLPLVRLVSRRRRGAHAEPVHAGRGRRHGRLPERDERVQADLGRAVLRPHLADQQQRAERHHARRRDRSRTRTPATWRRPRSSAVAGTTSARCRGIGTGTAPASTGCRATTTTSPRWVPSTT